MPADDDDYVEDVSDEEAVVSGSRRRAGRSGGDRARGADTNFEVTRTWDQLVEGADGSITGAVEGLLEAGKRKRYLPCLELGITVMLTKSLQVTQGHNPIAARNYSTSYTYSRHVTGYE